MKILFIIPNILINKSYPNKDASFSLGLGYLASIALGKGHEVKMVDTLLEGFNQSRVFNETFNEWGLSDEAVVEKVRNYNPDLIGITCTFTSRWPIVKRLSLAIKRKFPNKKIIVGGIHPSSSPQEVLKEEGVDFIIVGEGELAFEGFLDIMEKGREDYASISGLGFKKGGKLYINEEKSYVNDLDVFPFPARHLLPYEEYFKFNRNSIIATRGCPFKCVFCSMQAVMGRNFRTRSAKNFVDEIEFVQKTYHSVFFSFDDDNLTLREEFVFEFCEQIIKRGLKIYWNVPNGVNINSLTFESLSKMKEAGCYSLCLAIESADSEILEIMKKQVSLKKVQQIVEWCRQLHIFTLGFFLIGMPGETLESMERTRAYALSLPIEAINVSIVTPFPGTPFFKDCVEKGYVRNYSPDRFNIHESNISTDLLSAQQVKDFQVKFLKDFEDKKTPPFTHELLKKGVRNPGSVEFLEELKRNYFEKLLKIKGK